MFGALIELMANQTMDIALHNLGVFMKKFLAIFFKFLAIFFNVLYTGILVVALLCSIIGKFGMLYIVLISMLLIIWIISLIYSIKIK